MKIIQNIIIILAIFLFYSCTNKPVLSDLTNSRITLNLKGTYESNDPYLFTNETPVYVDDAYTLVADVPQDVISTEDLKFYIDIAEIRISKRNDISETTDKSEYWQYFARDRQVLCTSYGAMYDKELESCKENNGINKLQEFFSSGFNYPSVDIESGEYKHLAIFIRKFAISPAYYYDTAGNFVREALASFDNRKIYGYDIESLYQWNVSDDTNENEPRLFPLQRKDLKIKISESNKPYVFEIRILLKNILMKHLISDLKTDSSDINYLSFTAFSDWNSNHAHADINNKGKMGGSIIFNARAYVPEETGSVEISDSGISQSEKYYYAAIPVGENFDAATQMPYAAVSGKPAAEIKNLPEGKYNIYKTCDLTYKTEDDIDLPGNDGFPEKGVLCNEAEVPVNVTKQNKALVTFTCDCQ
ncbi:MAG: hypothetical protein OEZ22_00835 [Spirochaetia bacterium]|nr:hypothetical protein [Spirochaetia bacterium]